jgi:uncharacterized protein DUF6444
VPELPNLDHLSHAEKDALIRALWQRLEAAERRIAELEARLAEPGKTPDNSSLPPSKGQKPNQPEKTKRAGPRQGSLGRRGGGRPLALLPDETVTAKAAACTHCPAALTDADQVLHGRYDKIDLPMVGPVVTPCGSVMPDIVPAAAVSPWHRSRRAWRTARVWCLDVKARCDVNRKYKVPRSLFPKMRGRLHAAFRP